jgi:hypothetical protein
MLQMGKFDRLLIEFLTGITITIDQERRGLVLTIGKDPDCEQFFLHSEPMLIQCANTLLFAVQQFKSNGQGTSPTLH